MGSMQKIDTASVATVSRDEISETNLSRMDPASTIGDKNAVL